MEPELTLQTMATGLAGASERLRQAARCLVVTFGAVAAVVFAGISISSFGTLGADTETTQFVAALLGAGAAILLTDELGEGLVK